MLFAAALIIHSVAVPGTQLDVKLATQVGQPYDAATVEKDVRYLWSLGRFDDVSGRGARARRAGLSGSVLGRACCCATFDSNPTASASN